MKKKLLFGLLGMLAVLWIGQRAFSSREPVYNGKKVSAWIKELSRQNPLTAAAEKSLVEMGSEAVPYLEKALEDKETFGDKLYLAVWPMVPSAVSRHLQAPGSGGLRRLKATVILGRIGRQATNAVPELIRFLTADYAIVRQGNNLIKAPDQFLRQEAANALKAIGIAGHQATPGLTDLLTHRDYRVRWPASELLSSVQPPFTREFVLALAAALKPEDDRSRPNIVAALKRCDAASASTWSGLIANLQNTNDAVRFSAAEALGTLAPSTPEVVAALEHAMHDSEPGVRLEAAFAFWKNQPLPAAPAIELVLDGLKQEKPFWRRRAARYLGEMGSAAGDAVPALRAALKDKDPDARLLAARALARIDPDQIGVLIPILSEAVLDHSPRRRSWNAAQILGEIGPRAKDAIPVLAEAIDDYFPAVASAAMAALERIEPGLAARLRADPRYKQDLVFPALIHALKGSPELRGYAFQSLKAFGANAREAVPDMMAALEHPDLKSPKFDWVWIRALDAFGAIGPAATNAVPILLEAMRHSTVALRSGAASALGRVGLASPQVLAALVRALEDDEPVVRAYAARALGSFGPAAKDVLPALEKALRSEELQLHAMAMADAINKITPQTKGPTEPERRAD